MTTLITQIFLIKYSAICMQLQFAVACKRLPFCEVFRNKMESIGLIRLINEA